MAVGAVSPGHFMLARLDDVARWAQSSSVWPLTMGLACCAIEMMTRHRRPSTTSRAWARKSSAAHRARPI